MELVDQDGDRLAFRIDASGKLREYVNGKLELAEISVLDYSACDGTVRDQTGVFQIKEHERIEKALGLHALAQSAGVEWGGDEPTPADTLVLTDTDGDRLEFSLTEVGKLREVCNGKVELEEVKTMHFSFSDGIVHDDTGDFKLPASECMQKVAVLFSLATQAGVIWSGDKPSSSVRPKPRTLEIENCGSDWELQCPKRWEDLSVTHRSGERFCETCKETVYFCATEEQLQEHTRQRRCVAFDLREPSTVEEAAAVGSPPTEVGASDAISINVSLLSGHELPEVTLRPSQTVSSLKRALASATANDIPADEQRLLVDGQELADSETIVVAGITSQTMVQLVRVEKRLPALPPRVRTMGRRAAPRHPFRIA